MSQLPDHALTTLERVKDLLELKKSGHDALLVRFIAAVTDFIEGECGSRRFLQTTHTNEVKSIGGTAPEYVALKHQPVTELTSLEWRPGTPDNPSWTSFLASEYEVAGDGGSGLVRVYGGVPRGTNAVRATYVAGYLIDFDNPNDSTKHTLPFEISDLCERLVAKRFKRRKKEGQQSSSFEGSTVTWADLLDEADRGIISRYRRMPEFV